MLRVKATGARQRIPLGDTLLVRSAMEIALREMAASRGRPTQAGRAVRGAGSLA
jgi:hypothetical protein